MNAGVFSKLAQTATVFLALSAPVQLAHAGAIHDAGLFTTVFPANDDGSVGPVGIGFTIDFYGESYSSLYVNNNGNVTFDSALGTYTPYGITGGSLSMLAPFFADVWTYADVGSPILEVTYGTSTIDGHAVFGVNWINVGYFADSSGSKLNSFQLIITDRSDLGAGNFDFEFNYDTIAWETGSASGGVDGLGGTSAHVGWTNGAGTYQEFTGSGVNGALLDTGSDALVDGSLNSTTAGQYVFQVRNGQVVTTPVPEPATVLLFGLGLAGALRLRRKA